MNALVAGERFGFRPRHGFELHEAWRPLDAAVARWVLAHGGSVLLARVAAWASQADGQGDAALWLGADEGHRGGMPPLDDEAHAALAAEPMVGGPAGNEAHATPFVLDGDAFYLRRNFLHELAVAEALRARRATRAGAVGAPSGAKASAGPDDDTLRVLFNGRWRDEERAQRAAVAQAVGKRLFVLTGGPGTGKTTTVLRMLLALAADFGRQHAGRAPVVRLAAPTGKAAQRLADALRDGGRRIRERTADADATWQPLPAEWYGVLDGVLGSEAGTLHRLLGSRGRQGDFTHHRGNPLPADIVIVDEASMVDLALLRTLLDALRDDAVLVLVGDADQLTSVGTGSVLMDVVRALEGEGGDDLVRLRHCFRADTRLVPINEAVRRGDVAAFEAAWTPAETAAVARRQPVANRQALPGVLREWAAELQRGLSGVGAFGVVAGGIGSAPEGAPTASGCLAALRERQVLCALREGDFGSVEVNRRLEARLRTAEPLAGYAGADWYPGRAVIVTRNDAATGLYNGDIGLCLLLAAGDDEPRLQVVFDGAADSSTGARTLRCFDPDALPPSEGAFALTVHKSQGSEYRRVAVLLPPDAAHPLLSRQMLYTALSRAQSEVALWATEAAVGACLARVLRRMGRLAERISAGED